MDHRVLEARVASLERSLRKARLAAAILALGAVVVAAAAFAQQPAPSLEAQLEERLSTRLDSLVQEQTQERVATQRLALTDGVGLEFVVLAGGADGSLLVLTPSGQELMRLGGSAARRIGH